MTSVSEEGLNDLKRMRCKIDKMLGLSMMSYAGELDIFSKLFTGVLFKTKGISSTLSRWSIASCLVRKRQKEQKLP